MRAMQMHKTKWFLPAFAVASGAAFAVVQWIGGDPGEGLILLAIMTVVGLAILLGGRSDMVRGLRGDGRDEYWQRIDVHATALAGTVVIVANLAMCAWEWGHGRDGSPFVWLGALAGVAYLVALGFLRWRA
jgi:hypothetical protein